MRYRVVCGVILAGLMFSAQAADKIEDVAESCNGCHGANGVSETSSTPSIAGQPETYLRKVLLDWKNGVRHSETMVSLIKEYSEEQIGALAAHYARKPWTPVAQKLDANLVKRGEDAARRCAGCHGDTGKSNDAETPHLNGQWAEYLEADIQKFLDGSMVGSNPKMLKAMKKLSAEELKAAAAFYASQGK